MRKRESAFLFETSEGEVVSEQRSRTKGESEFFLVREKIVDPNQLYIDAFTDLVDVLDPDGEREIFMRMHCILPFKDGPTTMRGIARAMNISRFKVKRIYRLAMKKIRKVIYEEAKAAHDERRS